VRGGWQSAIARGRLRHAHQITVRASAVPDAWLALADQGHTFPQSETDLSFDPLYRARSEMYELQPTRPKPHEPLQVAMLKHVPADRTKPSRLVPRRRRIGGKGWLSCSQRPSIPASDRFLPALVNSLPDSPAAEPALVCGALCFRAGDRSKPFRSSGLISALSQAQSPRQIAIWRSVCAKSYGCRVVRSRQHAPQVHQRASVALLRGHSQVICAGSCPVQSQRLLTRRQRVEIPSCQRRAQNLYKLGRIWSRARRSDSAKLWVVCLPSKDPHPVCDRRTRSALTAPWRLRGVRVSFRSQYAGRST